MRDRYDNIADKRFLDSNTAHLAETGGGKYESTYIHPAPSPLGFGISWEGERGELKVKVFDPEGDLRKEIVADQSPTRVDVDRAEAGEWTYKVKAEGDYLESETSFAAMVGESTMRIESMTPAAEDIEVPVDEPIEIVFDQPILRGFFVLTKYLNLSLDKARVSNN